MPQILALSLSSTHTMSKQNVSTLTLIQGKGVQGDAHCGVKVKHRSRVRQNPDQPNLRQVHLMHNEIIEELNDKGYDLAHGQMGENITTSGIDLLGLPQFTELHIADTIITVTGLRNPCDQLNGLRDGLLSEMVDRTPDGKLIRRAGIMGIVSRGGSISCGDEIRVVLPPKPHSPLDRV